MKEVRISNIINEYLTWFVQILYRIFLVGFLVAMGFEVKLTLGPASNTDVRILQLNHFVTMKKFPSFQIFVMPWLRIDTLLLLLAWKLK